MAAPATTTRGTPAGKRLVNSHQSLLAFARLPTFSVWEKEVNSPALDGGEPIDITSQHELLVRIREFRDLYDLLPFTIKCFCDPNAFKQAKNSLINQNGSITRRYPDGSTLDFFGALTKYEEDPAPEDGQAVMVTLTITPSNYDPANRVEAEPVLTEVSGT